MEIIKIVIKIKHEFTLFILQLNRNKNKKINTYLD